MRGKRDRGPRNTAAAPLGYAAPYRICRQTAGRERPGAEPPAAPDFSIQELLNV